jgi:hypothetical protein
VSSLLHVTDSPFLGRSLGRGLNVADQAKAFAGDVSAALVAEVVVLLIVGHFEGVPWGEKRFADREVRHMGRRIFWSLYAPETDSSCLQDGVKYSQSGSLMPANLVQPGDLTREARCLVLLLPLLPESSIRPFRDR